MTFREKGRTHYLRRQHHHRSVTVTRHQEPEKVIPFSERALVATSEQEYRRLRRDFPLKKIILDIRYVQTELFSTRGFIDV